MFFLFSFPDDVKEHSNEYYETPNMKNEHTLLEVSISDKISHDLAPVMLDRLLIVLEPG